MLHRSQRSLSRLQDKITTRKLLLPPAHSQDQSHSQQSVRRQPTVCTLSTSVSRDWSAHQYLLFANERTRPVYDLISQVRPLLKTPKPRIMDLGCGPGNSTEALLYAFPETLITGVDSSPDMLARARARLPAIEFIEGDLSTFKLPDQESISLLFSNAVFQWLRSSVRIPILTRLFSALSSGGILAFQVPDNYGERSHALMRETAASESEPWSRFFADTRIGDIEDITRPDLDPIEPHDEFYNAFAPLAVSVNIWRTTYFHVLSNAGGIVEWVKGTGLQPFLHEIADEEAKAGFLKEYEARLAIEYPSLTDGKVILSYPRLFIVAQRA